ncbi:ferric reductase NAD binding domain-containing protein [Xylariaceae sp. FL1019]|nr:ferric reductase NAD binding domain-containing protein [Xylariaceae sp. FL1019]
MCLTSPIFMRSAGPNTQGELGGFAVAMARRQKVNVEILTYYAASLVAVMAIFILGHWIRYFVGRRKSQTSILYPFLSVTRISRKALLRKIPGFTSIGHALVVTIFVALNATFSFCRVDTSKASNFASRFGWMAAANMVLVVFLALKNTPLALFTTYSYERLNKLHQIAGYTTLLYTILHGSIYAGYFIQIGKIELLREEIVTAGIILGFAVLITSLAGGILRHFNYELFYIVHLALFGVIVVALGLHRPSFDGAKILVATVFLASLWFTDRLLRFARLTWNGVNNKATVFPLPDGATRIIFHKPLHRARPGKHCYVWLPHIRTFQTHPFTIVSSEPLELVINSFSGFTKDLHNYAQQNPGASLTASLEGPYGTLPDPMDYDKVVLLAGGSGATFTFGIAADMVERMNQESEKQIDFIWATRSHDNIAWFAKHLNNLMLHEHSPKIALKLHLTRLPTTQPITVPAPHSTSQSSRTSTEAASVSQTDEKHVISIRTSSSTLRDRDMEKASNRPVLSGIEEIPKVIDYSHLPVTHGRPDVEAMIRDAVSSTTKEQRILIAVCGPAGLVNAVRNTTASCISVGGPAIELHCEEFGW